MSKQALDPQRWRRINELFDVAADLDPSEREEWLLGETWDDETVGGEVRKLLARHDTESGWIDQSVPGARFLTADANPLSAGALIAGKYELIGPLGIDGPCEMYAAQGATLRIINTTPDSAVAAALFDFGRRSVLVRHPNLCGVLGVDAVQLPAREAIVLAEEAMDGRPLDMTLTQVQALPVARVLELLRQIASGLTAIHESKLWHGAFHAGHVLVSEDLSDARVCGWGSVHAPSILEALDPELQSPEQLLGEEITATTDIYCFGLLAYELLTSRRPFMGRNKLQSALLRLSQAPFPVNEARSDLPVECADALMACLARAPGKRERGFRVLARRRGGDI